MITKQIAGLLYGFNYQLQDNEGNVWDITGLDPTRMALNFSRLVKFSEIGSTYKILAREMDLTKPIEGVGVPLIELAKMVSLDPNWELHSGANRVINKENFRQFTYDAVIKGFQYWEANEWLAIPNQLALFNWLYTHKFNLDLPEGTTTNLI